MNTLNLGIKKVHQFVGEQIALGNDVRWDGWELVFFRPEPKGIYSPAGAFRNGQWGFENRHTVDDDGIWRVDFRNVVKRPKKKNARHI